MSQVQTVPGPSQDAFDTLSEQIATFKYKNYTIAPSSAITAGTIGTRGAQKIVSLASDKPSGYNTISVTIVDIANSSGIIPVAFLSGNNVVVNYYRATESQVSVADATVTVQVAWTNKLTAIS